ncbi:MAG: hypothetical protein KGO05_05290 [Chloroflexota bacterium]|nr:hypothetical protein [Chloroflexota bacterium]
MSPQGRQLGSLQRRLQRSHDSGAGDDDDYGGDQRDRSRGGRGGERGRRSRPLDDYGDSRGEQGRRSHPSSGASRRGGRDYTGFDDDSREEPAYRPASDESREYAAWDASVEGPSYQPQRGRGTNSRYRPPEDSAEMSAEGPAYTPPRRSTPSRRSHPDERHGDRDDNNNPLDDPRSPLGGSRGGQGRRPSQGSRGAARRPADGYPGETEGEMESAGYPNSRDPRGFRDAGRSSDSAQRGPRGWGGDGNQGYGQDDYASREGWAAPSDFSAPYTAYPPNQRQRGGYDEGSAMWPVANELAPSRRDSGGRGGSRGGKPPKRKGSPLKVVFGLLLTLVVVALVGVEVGPKVYHLLVSRGAIGGPQTSTTCASQATPPTAQTPAAHATATSGPVAFATTAYTLTYPNGWQQSTQSGASGGLCDVVFLFAQPGGAARFNIEQAGAFAPITDLQVIQAEAQTAKQGGSTLTEITSAATTETVGGEVWQRREYQVTTKGGVKLRLALLAGHHKGAGYAIVMVDSDTGFAGDDTTLFEPILRSLKFV